MSQTAVQRRVGIGLVVAGYAGVLLVAAALLTQRYLAERRSPSDFSGGMAAGGDWFLELFLVGLLLVPTALLALLIRNSEAAYTKFARILLGFAISAPVSVGLMAIPAVGQSSSLLGFVCLYRVFAFPMTTVGLTGSCILAKFTRPRRIILYALLIEIATMAVLFTLTTLKV